MSVLRPLLVAVVLVSPMPVLAQDGQTLFQVPEGCTPF
jgi:hypothetical protein